MGHLYYISSTDWQNFLQEMSEEWNIFAPVRNGKNLLYQRISKNELPGIELSSHRAVQPLKSFLFFFYEQITNIAKFPNLRDVAVIGLKACDLHSLQLYDKMFLEGEFVEPFYKRKRQDLLLISSDCQDPLDSCFCTLLGYMPHPEEYFDINLSAVSSGLVADVNSDKGEEFIRAKKDLFKKVVDREILMRREAKRRAITETVEKANSGWDIKSPFLDFLRPKLNSSVWAKMSETCVTCGACTQICPTCYCFLITEEMKSKKEDTTNKYRCWDSCQYTGFARVAGGANPRKKVHERLRHRYLHKFDYIRENFGFDGCTGCGRCIQACLGRIDMRKVLSELKNA